MQGKMNSIGFSLFCCDHVHPCILSTNGHPGAFFFFFAIFLSLLEISKTEKVSS